MIRHDNAVIVLPALLDGSVRDTGVRRWLARADLEIGAEPQEILPRVLRAMGQEPCSDGLAALRFWGQTGDRPAVWMAAADPVHLEAQLDHLRLRSLWSDEWQIEELRQLFAELQAQLADDATVGFISVGSYGYLRSDLPMPTAALSPELANGCNPVGVLPAGRGADRYQALLSEIQMAMHNSPINQGRESRDLRAINSLWVWGGGVITNDGVRDVPPLLADDEILRGYWLSSRGGIESWPDGLVAGLSRFSDGFVAVAPDQANSADEHAELLTGYLRDLRELLRHSDLRRLTILFRQGVTACVRPRQIFRVWRRELSSLSSGPLL